MTEAEVVAARDRSARAQADADVASKAFLDAVNRFWSEHEHYVFSATTRCEKCMAPLAYRHGTGSFGVWRCWEILKNKAIPGVHTELPFTFYDVKGENAYGSTRPPEAGPAFVAPWWDK